MLSVKCLWLWGVKVTHYCFPHGLHYTEGSDFLFLKGGEWYDLPLGLWEDEINVFFSNSSTKYQYKTKQKPLEIVYETRLRKLWKVAHWDDWEVSFFSLLLPYICQTWSIQSNLKHQQVHTKMPQQNSALPKYQKRRILAMQKTFRWFCFTPENVPHTCIHTHTHTFTHKWLQSSKCQHDSLDTMLKKCKEHLHTSRHLILNSNSFHRISEDHPHPEAMRDPSTSKQEIILLLRIWKHLN